MKRLPRLRADDVVEVVWLDSVRRGGWDDRKSYTSWARDTADLKHRSVGYVLGDTDDVVVLLRSQSTFPDGYESVTDVISIPLVGVLNVTVLRRADG